MAIIFYLLVPNYYIVLKQSQWKTYCEKLPHFLGCEIRVDFEKQIVVLNNFLFDGVTPYSEHTKNNTNFVSMLKLVKVCLGTLQLLILES